MLEPWLAFAHLSAVLAWVVFASSQTALCRSEWLNAAALERLARLDRILWWATAAIVLTGLARIHLGARGSAWYWGNPLMYAKLGLWLLATVWQARASRRVRRWQATARAGQGLPDEADIRSARRALLLATHVVALIPLAAVFLARGWGGAG